MTLLRPLLLVLLLVAAPAAAQEFPKLTGRVVDAANILPEEEEVALTQKLAALEQKASRQLVVATVPSLQDHPIEDYGYRLGRAWGIGQKEADNGVILLVAPNERRVRIEVGYGLEPIVTDALSHVIITEQIRPRFKEGDYSGGIRAGTDALIAQLQAPPEQQEQRAIAAQQQVAQQRSASAKGGSGFGGAGMLIFWIVVLVVLMPMLHGGRRGRRRRGGVFIWGPGMGGDWGGGGGSSWGGGGGGGWGGGGGGFSGGGGSFGGGGASGGW